MMRITVPISAFKHAGMEADKAHHASQRFCEVSGNLIHEGRTEQEAGLMRWMAFARHYAATSNSPHAQGIRGALAQLDARARGDAPDRSQGG